MLNPTLRAILAAERTHNGQAADAATPVVDITYSTGRGERELHVTIATGVVLGDGYTAYIAEPAGLGTVRRFPDPDPTTTVRWVALRARSIPAGMTIRYFRAGTDVPYRTETA
jgi:hypothetical protein